MIDRGRFESNIKIVRPLEVWKQMVETVGFNIESIIPHLSKTLISIWDIGLRPIFPILKLMADSIDEGKKYEIKKQWIESLKAFVLPIVENDIKKMQNEEGCFYCLILSK